MPVNRQGRNAPAEPQRSVLKRFVREAFGREIVDIDGAEFIECEFRGATLRYGGGEVPRIIRCSFSDTRIAVAGPAARTVTFLRLPGGLARRPPAQNGIRLPVPGFTPIMQPQQQVIFLSDGADTLQRLQQNIAREAEHVLDWFHLSMRLTVLRQMIKGAWTDAATIEARTASLERIKWLLWHGNAPDAIDDTEYLADDVAAESEVNPSSTPLRKLTVALGEFNTYVDNNRGHIVNYGERFRAGERISTGFVESAINQIVDKRMDKGQSMRWTLPGAHLLLQTRTCVLNGDLDRLIRSHYLASKSSRADHPAPGL